MFIEDNSLTKYHYIYVSTNISTQRTKKKKHLQLDKIKTLSTKIDS